MEPAQAPTGLVADVKSEAVTATNVQAGMTWAFMFDDQAPLTAVHHVASCELVVEPVPEKNNLFRMVATPGIAYWSRTLIV